MRPSRRHAGRPFARAAVCSLLLLIGLTGCQPRPIDAPLETALSPDASASRRVRAVYLVPDGAVFELMALLSSSRHPMRVREAALDHMLANDADRFWSGLTVRIRSVSDWPMLTLLAERASLERRADAVPALVISWARPSTRYRDTDRPERAAIATITGDPEPTGVLWAVFAGDGAWEPAPRLSEAAWAVLCRRLTREDLLTGLGEHPDPFGLAELLLTAGSAVDVLPGDREGLAWLRAVSAGSTPEDWQRRADTIQKHGAGPATLALRHLPLIDRLDHRGIAPMRSDQLAALQQRLRGAQHASRGAGDIGSANIRATPDRLADHANRLSWADLLVLDALLDALADPALVASLFDQAERDRQDTTTEHGGVLVWSETGAVVARAYAPMLRRHDQEYLASDACIEAMYAGLAHYHFHAQHYDNALWAGPGGGDLRFADNLHAHCVVFTFIDRDTLNADAYFPGGIVVDLGCIRR